MNARRHNWTAAKAAARYLDRKLRQVCVECGAGLQDDDGVRCVECTEKQQDYQASPAGLVARRTKRRNWRKAQIARGRCLFCSKPAMVLNGKLLQVCEDHRRIAAERHQAWRDKRAGLQPRRHVMHKSATISPDGMYRYRLERIWDNTMPRLTFIMLNPSKADAELDDPTIRLCMGWARRANCGGIVVVNLFAYRATDPADLARAERPVGEDNTEAIADAIEGARLGGEEGGPLGSGFVYVAWGNPPQPVAEVAALTASFIVHAASQAGVRLFAIATTKEGNPRHPLRLSYNLVPQPWPPASIADRGEIIRTPHVPEETFDADVTPVEIPDPHG